MNKQMFQHPDTFVTHIVIFNTCFIDTLDCYDNTLAYYPTNYFLQMVPHKATFP